MNDILWIGGPAAAGKTRISRLLARKHGLVWYSVDAHAFDHEQRAAAAGLHVLGSGPGEFDRHPMILEDIRSVAATVVVEGAFVRPAMAADANALWLMPSRAEQLARLQRRNPDTNLEGLIWGWNLIQSQLEGTGATVIEVDGQTIDQTLQAVEHHFADLLPTGPIALRDRQSRIRTGNLQLADRPTPQLFDCECGRPTCTAFVELPPEQAATLLPLQPPAITAPNHH